MGKKNYLRSQEFALALKVKTKRRLVEDLVARYAELREQVSEAKAELRELIEEHKEVREQLKEQEGY
jgi:flagellar biosynthesis chaperone FliJ